MGGFCLEFRNSRNHHELNDTANTLYFYALSLPRIENLVKSERIACHMACNNQIRFTMFLHCFYDFVFGMHTYESADTGIRISFVLIGRWSSYPYICTLILPAKLSFEPTQASGCCPVKASAYSRISSSSSITSCTVQRGLRVVRASIFSCTCRSANMSAGGGKRQQINLIAWPHHLSEYDCGLCAARFPFSMFT